MSFEYRFTLGMSSVDGAGVLFYPELFRHAHDAYEAFMREVGMELAELLQEGVYALPIVHAEADYLKPMRHGATFTVRLVVARIGDSSFNLEVGFFDPSSEPCARVHTVHVWLERATGKAAALPEEVRRKLAGP